MTRPRWRRVRIAIGALCVVLLGLTAATCASSSGLSAFGSAPTDVQLARMRAGAPNNAFHDGAFVNDEPIRMMTSPLASTLHALLGDEMRAPTCPLPMVTDTAARLATPSTTGLRVTWLGHSTALIEIDGATILSDPMWSARASPSTWLGPKRFHPPPLALADLPHLDAVVVSHEHYDHLDMATIIALAQSGVVFHVPLGVGAHLAGWGVAAAQIVEHEWWQAADITANVSLVSTPARHFNGRGVPGRIGALWTSWSILGPAHRAFVSGDTGETAAHAALGRRFGPFDVALIEIGQSDVTWPDVHLGPAGAMGAYRDVRARVLLPIHWGTFQLAYHAWSQPPEALLALAAATDTIATPLLGQPLELGAATVPKTHAWWRALPPIAAECP